jgi:chaperonin cofactor prefoldin
VAATLDVPPARVFPLSARQALAGRVNDDAQLVAVSRLPALEDALSAQLLPQRSLVLGHLVRDAMDRLQAQVSRRLADQRRQLNEQLAELRGLRGKSGGKVDLMLRRSQQEEADFEACTGRLAALKSVHARQLRALMVLMSSDRLRREVALMRKDAEGSLFKLGARKAFRALGERLDTTLQQAAQRMAEIEAMLGAGFRQLNADNGFALNLTPPPTTERAARDLKLIQDSYERYLGAGNLLRLAERGYLDHFLRMLLSKLRVVFENAGAEFELWNKTTMAQLDMQLRDRRVSFQRRHESLERVQQAATELEQRIAEVEDQEQRLAQRLTRVAEQAAALRVMAEAPPQAEAGAPAVERSAPYLSLVRPGPLAGNAA